MYSLFKQPGIKKQLAFELPVIGISLITMELFYKFGSFTLECLAFAGTWFIASLIIDKIQKIFH